MAQDIAQTTAAQISQSVHSGERSAREVAREALDRVARTNPKLNAILRVDEDLALQKAQAVDEAVARGDDPGPLAGVPVAIKDVLCMEGQVTSCGSRMLEGFRPPYTATSVERLLAAGAVPLGRTNMDEFAMGSSNENSAFGPVRNPWNSDCVSGGSSGGSAVAVAAGQTPVSLGTDTGGSIRQPAAFCGVVGFKPTYGSVSRYGLVAFASSLDQVGAFGYTVDDVALVMEAISGKDACDATSADQPPIRAAQRDGLKDVRVGIPREYFGEGLDASVEARIRESIDALRDLGATIVDVSLPHARYYVPTYYLIATAEASSNLARYEGVHYGHRSQRDVRDSSLSPIVRLYALTRGEAFGAEVKRRIMLGTYALSAGYKEAYYGKALKVRGLIRQDFVNAFEQVDCIATPTAPTEAFAIGEKSEDPLAMYLSDIYTLGVSLAGLPGVSLPCGLGARGLPVGLQLIGRHFHDGDLLGIAAAWQASTRFHLARPEAFV